MSTGYPNSTGLWAAKIISAPRTAVMHIHMSHPTNDENRMEENFVCS